MRILALYFCILFPLIGFSQDANSLFKLGNKAYEENDFKTAINQYESVLDKGLNSFELHYNLGNAYFKNQEIGKSILHYEKAYKINNEDDDLNFNLDFSRSFIVDKIEELPSPSVLRWWSTFKASQHPDFWAKWALISIVFFSIIIVIRIFINSRSGKKLTVFTGVIIFLFSIISLSMSYISDISVKKEAILIHTNTNIKSAPSTSAEDLFILHEGVKMQIIEELNGWNKIKLSDGMIGWLPSVDIEEI